MIRISESLHELAALGGDEAAVIAWLAARGVEVAPATERPRCTALRDAELECDGEVHYSGVFAGVRRCGLLRYRRERARLAERLASCGYGVHLDETTNDVAEHLLAGIDLGRDVEGLREMVAVGREACADPMRANVALTGTCGTAKTVVLLAILFAALRKGIDAVFVPMHELRELAQALDAFDPYTKAAAQTKRAGLSRRELLVLDDLADREAGRPTTEGVLLDILAGGAVTAFSSNLNSDKLKEHADVSHRVVSRLYADRKGEPVRGQYVKGHDQRHHALQLRLLKGGRK